MQKSSESAGLAQGDQAYRDFLAASPEGRRAAVVPFHDMLASLAQYMGLDHAECAEQDFVGETLVMDQNVLVDKIEAALGQTIVFPAVFDGLYGLSIRERVLHGRDIQALYAALRTIEASGQTTPAICEIGGGFGKVAQYAWLRGVRRYTIVDLPTVCAMQYFYLRRTLPEASITLGSGDEKVDGDGIPSSSRLARHRAGAFRRHRAQLRTPFRRWATPSVETISGAFCTGRRFCSA